MLSRLGLSSDGGQPEERSRRLGSDGGHQEERRRPSYDGGQPKERRGPGYDGGQIEERNLRLGGYSERERRSLVKGIKTGIRHFTSHLGSQILNFRGQASENIDY